MKKILPLLLLISTPAVACDMTAICEYSLRDFKTQNLISSEKVSVHYSISKEGIPNLHSYSLLKTDSLEIGFMPNYVGSQRLWYVGKNELLAFSEATPNLGQVEQTHSALRVENPSVGKLEVNCFFLKGKW